ncbi:MAG TPA: DinB family protein [Euzebyales bacterium]|nr:DinB family protein [Euzebyales bacterium]
MQRQDPAVDADERSMLNQFLDFHRATLLWKVEGLDREQLNTTTAASTLTLAGLLKHLAVCEDGWFRGALLGEEPALWWRHVDGDADPDWDFRTAADDDPADLIARYEHACERSRQAVAGVASLDELGVETSRRTGARYSLRWILLHMIEETARHNGHADLLRDAIDGSTGE